MEKLLVGIIDDDSSKVTQIMTHLYDNWVNASDEKRTKYSKYEIEPYEIEVSNTIDEIIDKIYELHCDCVLIDYRLSSFATNGFNGVDLANELQRKLHGFPMFILTSYEDEIYTKETFDVYQIFNFARYQNDADERIELNSKIIEQILKYRKERSAWEAELLELLPRSGENAEIDSRILLLDNYIEKAINGKHMIPEITKEQLSVNKIDTLLKKLDELIDKD